MNVVVILICLNIDEHSIFIIYNSIKLILEMVPKFRSHYLFKYIVNQLIKICSYINEYVQS